MMTQASPVYICDFLFLILTKGFISAWLSANDSNDAGHWACLHVSVSQKNRRVIGTILGSVRSSANETPVSVSRDHSGPIRGQGFVPLSSCHKHKSPDCHIPDTVIIISNTKCGYDPGVWWISQYLHLIHAWGQLRLAWALHCDLNGHIGHMSVFFCQWIMYRSCRSQMQLTTCSRAANIGFLQNFPHKVCALQHNFGELMRATPQLKPESVRSKHWPSPSGIWTKSLKQINLVA